MPILFARGCQNRLLNFASGNEVGYVAHTMIQIFHWSESYMGCLWRVLKGASVLIALIICLGFAIYHTTWFQKKYLYPLPHRELVFHYAQEYNVDPYLVFAVIRAESKYLTTATSPKGARGLMQIMPETGVWIAGRLKLADYHSEMLYEPETNIRFGVWYLSSLREEFDNNPVLSLAAYNGGRGNVKQWKQQYQWGTDFTDVEQIPFKETRLYVGKVLKAHEKYRELYTTER
jgi:soluble lytic murein transglycosylase